MTKGTSLSTNLRHLPVPSIFPVLLLGATLSSPAPPLAAGGDWPQILGPSRSGCAFSEPPLGGWPNTGPEVLWSHEVGSGYAGPAVAGRRVVVFHRVGNVERLEALDAGAGTALWKADFPATYAGGVNPDNGPRCVPLIHEDRVYVFGAAGDLHCVQLGDGQKQWSRDAYGDLEGREGYFGAGSTPIVAEDKLLVNVGGRNAGLVAFDLETGRTLWAATDEGASYSSPTSAVLDGRKHVIFVTRMNTVSVDPENGAVRFRFPFGRSGPTVNAATPLVFDEQLFVSAAYGVGARLARIRDGRAETIWANDEVMSSQYSTCVYHRGYLYGVHGREDYANGELRCLEARTGKLQWTERGFGIAHLILVDDKLLILSTEGQLYLAEASPEKFHKLASAQISSNMTRALPALSNGRLYFRENAADRGQLRCLALAGK